jgi:hypothetical protein
VMALPPKYSIEPMDLANMRQNSVRSLLVMCYGCPHEVILNVDQYPGDLLVRVSAAHGLHEMWDGRCRSSAELERGEQVTRARH